MPLFSWLTKRLTGRPQKRRAAACRPAPRFRPQLEELEERTVPSTFYAATASDLIQDIHVANLQGGANTIVLTAPTSSPYVMTAVNNSTDGPIALPQIAAGDNLTICTGNGSATPGYGDVLDAGKHGRLFDVAAGGSLTLQNVTLQNGYVTRLLGTQNGGAIDNHGTLVLSQVMVQNCAVAGWGGQGQSAAGGGIWSDGTLTVGNASVFQGNSATGSNAYGTPARGGNAYGGAICIAGGTANITDTFFGAFNQSHGNSALGGTGSAPGSGYGGAVYVAAGTVTLGGDTVGNDSGGSNKMSNLAQGGGDASSGYGGGICVAGGTVTMTDDTIIMNHAGGYGTNSLGNHSVGRGCGIYVAPGATVYLDSFTVAHARNYDNGVNGNIYGTYTLLS